jgi:hypothetical protein
LLRSACVRTFRFARRLDPCLRRGDKLLRGEGLRELGRG